MLRNNLLREGDYKSTREMISRIRRMIPDTRILGELDSQKKIIHYTVKEVYEQVMSLGDGLLAHGYAGKHIAVVADNCVRYIYLDMTISSGVGVVVPINKYIPVQLKKELFDKGDVSAVFCSSDMVEEMEQIKSELPKFESIITIDKKVEGYLYYGEIVERGAAEKGKGEFSMMELDIDAPAKLLFTSGTTGANKGVILTNANIAANFVNCLDVIEANGNFTSMSVLPMHHATEINSHIMTRIAAGRLTYISENMSHLMTNLKIFKPECITIVPMIANAFYSNIWRGAKKAGMEEKLKKGIKVSNLLRKFGIDRTHTMFAQLLEPFGGRLRMIVCGGAMLNPVVIKGLYDFGIRVENAYGITECGPLISMNSNPLEENLSVGRPCPQLQVRIDSPDENGVGDLCVKGLSVAKGYYKDEAATAAVFGADGFFNTGDSARIDSNGRIILLGRKKNSIVLENGKNVSPEEIENVIESKMGYVDDIIVYSAEWSENGSSRNVICAGLFIADEDIRNNTGKILDDVRRVNETLPDYKAVEYVELPAQEYPKTAMKKVKRINLPEKCSGEGIKVF